MPAEKGFSPEELVEAGLLVKNADKGSIYDAYRGRVIFPIVGVNGRVIGFGARVLNNEEKPKYINTGDTLLYNKRNNLYGLHLQKSGKLPDLVMVEGYTDVIGLYEAGVTNAVASLGTALTQQQARLLKRYVSQVYIAYDGDAAGQNATIRGLDILRAEGLDVRVIVFPDDLDPDEFIRKRGKDAFDALKDQALSLNAFKLDSMANGFDLTRKIRDGGLLIYIRLAAGRAGKVFQPPCEENRLPRGCARGAGKDGAARGGAAAV